MRLARLINTLAGNSTGRWNLVSPCGFRGAPLFLRDTYLNSWLSLERLRALTARRPQLRLMI